MKIAYLITRMDELCGPQLHVRDMSMWLKGQGHQVVVLSGWPGKISDFLQHQGVEYIEIPDLESPAHLLKDIKALWQTWKALRRIQPDVVACHTPKAGLIGRMAARLAGISSLYTAHGWAFSDGNAEDDKGAALALEKTGALFGSRVIVTSVSDRDLAIEKGVTGVKALAVIPNSVPDRKAVTHPERSGTVRLIMVAKVGPQKDHARLLRALWGCMDLDWTLDLVGSGDDMDLRNLASQLDMDGRVNFLGEREDVAEMLEKRAEIYLHISNWEGMPFSILEAMRAGLPVISSDIGGVREVVVDQQTGLLVPPGEDQPLISALRKLIPDRSLQREMGKKGRERFESVFGFSSMAQAALALYQSLAPVDKPVASKSAD